MCFITYYHFKMVCKVWISAAPDAEFGICCNYNFVFIKFRKLLFFRNILIKIQAWQG